jgi:Zn ribbon nucleic-acid-binding protein
MKTICAECPVCNEDLESTITESGVEYYCYTCGYFEAEYDE